MKTGGAQPVKHSLDLTIRESGRHRFHASCSCAKWTGVPVRRRREAEEQYRRHVNAEERATRTVRRRGRRRAAPQPRQLTPIDQLPDALRVVRKEPHDHDPA